MSRKHAALFVLLSAVWGTNFVAQKVALRHADPILLTAIRFWGAALMLGAWSVAAGRAPVPHRRDLPALVLVGVVGPGLHGTFLFLGLDRVTAGLASILLYTFPLFTAGLAALFLHERIDASRGTGILLGFLGVVLLSGRPVGGTLPGVLFLLVAAASWAAGSVVYKRVAPGPDVVVVTVWSLLSAAVFASAVSLAVEGIPRVEPRSELLWAYLYMTVPGMAGAWALWYFLLERGEAARASAFLFMTPAFGVLSGWVALSETVTWTQVAAGLLVAGGIYLVGRRPAVVAAVPE